MESGLSASDVAMLNRSADGDWGGNSFMWIFALLILAGGGFGNWNNRNGEFNNFATAASQSEILLGQKFDTLSRQINQVGDGLCSSTYALNNSIHNAQDVVSGAVVNEGRALQSQLADCCCKTQQGTKDTQYAIATTGAGIQSAIKDCCCETDKQFMQTRYDNAQQNCATLQAISDGTKQIIDYMAAEKTQNLRDENFALKLAASQANQNNFIQNLVKPPINPCYVTQNPYCSCGNANPYGFGYGYGTTIA